MKLKTREQMNFSSRRQVDFEMEDEVLLVRFPLAFGARHFYFSSKKKAQEKWKELQNDLATVGEIGTYKEMSNFFHLIYTDWEDFWFALEKIVGDLGHYKNEPKLPTIFPKSVSNNDVLMTAIGITEKREKTSGRAYRLKLKEDENVVAEEKK